MSPELKLIVAPGRTYAALASGPSTIGPIRALRRPFLVAVIIGVATALSPTRHLTPALVFATTTLWSVVVMAQVAIALAVIGRPPRGAIGRPRALDLFFASHAPWSLWWLFAMAWGAIALGRTAAPVYVAALLPIALTPRMIAAYFREVLGLDRRSAAIRMLVHQFITWTAFGLFWGWAVALWPRVLQTIR
jgi:hypothetical protein